MDVVAQSGPLPEKQKLQIGEELHILPQKCAVLVQHGLVLTQAKVVVGPLRPCLHAEMAFAGHVQGIVRQPPRIVLRKGRYGLRVPLPAPFVGLVQQGKAALVDLSVVHMARVAAPVGGGALGGRQQSVSRQHIRVDVVGVAGVGGKALVGAVTVAGRADGQDLPIGLLCLGQKINECGRFTAQRTDPKRPRQAEHRHQNAACTHTVHLLSPLQHRPRHPR